MANEKSPVVPDMAEYLQGWRIWRVVGKRIKSWNHNETWEPGMQKMAFCGNLLFRVYDGHRSPGEDCSCGIYAKAAPPPWEDIFYSPSTPGIVFGRVAGWGKVVQGGAGWRAQYAYPLSLSDRRLAKVYGVEYEKDCTPLPVLTKLMRIFVSLVSLNCIISAVNEFFRPGGTGRGALFIFAINLPAAVFLMWAWWRKIR